MAVQAGEVVAQRALGMTAQWQLAPVDSGYSPTLPSSTLLFCCHVWKPPKKIASSGRLRSLACPCIEKFARQRELRSRACSSHEIAADLRRIPKALFAIPAEMFSRDPDSGRLAVEGVQGVEMRKDNITHLRSRECGVTISAVEKRVDSAEDPWRAVTRADDHYPVSTGEIKYFPRLLRCVDITVGEHWNPDG